jgi:hypothetical protein
MTETRQGQAVTLTSNWYEYAGGPADDVTGLTIEIVRLSDDTTVTGPTAVGITHPATGVYAYSWTPAADAELGDYLAVWAADGGLQSTETVTVLASYGVLYATLAELKRQLNIPPTTTDHDDDLTTRLVAASRGIDDYTDRRFWLDDTATAKTINPKRRTIKDDDGEQLLLPWDIGSEDDLVVEVGSGSSWTAVTDYELTPDAALDENKPVTGLLRTGGVWQFTPLNRVRIAARWGYPVLPQVVTDATLLQAARLFKRRQSPEGVLGNSEFGLIRVARLDPDVQELVHRLARTEAG